MTKLFTVKVYKKLSITDKFYPFIFISMNLTLWSAVQTQFFDQIVVEINFIDSIELMILQTDQNNEPIMLFVNDD
jgi:integral membrane sensor domain MASE1